MYALRVVVAVLGVLVLSGVCGSFWSSSTAVCRANRVQFRPSQYDLDMIIKLAEKQKKELPDAVRTYVPPAQDDDGRDLDEVDSGKERPSKVQRRSREGRGSGAPSRSGGVQRSGGAVAGRGKRAMHSIGKQGARVT